MRIGSVGAAFLATLLALSGCVSGTFMDMNMNMNQKEEMGMDMSHGGMHSMPITDRTTFALAMIPHHEQAIVMSEYAMTNTQNLDVLELANQIIAEQAPEIKQMTPWLNGQEVDRSMIMQGMLAPDQLAKLAKAKDAEFDELYIKYMIMHHEGAVQMATEAATLGDDELSAFSKSVISAQLTEIAILKNLLK